MKTNATTKTKEEELSEWILEKMKYHGATHKDLPWVAMDDDDEIYAFSRQPIKEWKARGWARGGADFLFMGELPKHLRLYPWGKFLLRWVDVPKPERSLVLGHTTRVNAEGRVVIVEHHADGFTREIDYGNECAKSALRALTSLPVPPSPALPLPAFQREVWAADVMSEAYRITVAIVEEPLPAPQEVPHWRLPTDEELDRLLPGGWMERCPLDL